MGNNWKYTLQKHKGKAWLAGSIATTAVVGAGVWLVVSENSPFHSPEDAINHLASHVITGNIDGGLQLVSVETKETLNQLTLPAGETYLYAPSADREAVYAYDGKRLVELKEESGTLVQRVVAEELPNVSAPTSFAYADDQLLVFSETSGEVTAIDVPAATVTNQAKEKEQVIQVGVANGYPHYITESELVRFNGLDAERVELGKSLKSMHADGETLVIQSDFGKGKGENVLFHVNLESLDIETLQKTGSPNTALLQKDDGERFYLAGHFVDAEFPYYLMERYEVGTAGLVKDSLGVQVPVGEQQVAFEDFTKTVSDHDYLYTHVGNALKLYDVKSQAFLEEVPVDIEFAMPVLLEKGVDENE